MASVKEVLEAHLCPEEQPVALLECAQAFDKLTDKEKLYLHHLNEASWAGARVVAKQVSEESPAIFDLLLGIFGRTGGDLAELKASLLAAGLSEEAHKALVQYAAAFFGNMGNYLSFGDTKFVPRFTMEDLETAIAACDVDGRLKAIYESAGLRSKMWSLSSEERALGLGSEGSSSYYSANIEESDVAFVQEFMTEQKLSAYNTRLFKADDGSFRLCIASAEPRAAQAHVYKERSIAVEYGDFREELAAVAASLERASEYAANDNQRNMLAAYVQHFLKGDVDLHKDAQRHWILDSGPVIETNIGFVESYRDPFGVRAEFESFVAMVDKVMSAKFSTLVDKAEHFLTKMPWDKTFEKDTFTRPDFTALTVCNFVTSGLPAGINLPNYDDVKDSNGFKNVSLSNVLSSSPSSLKVTFLTAEDEELYKKLQAPAFEVQVALHELLGHGSGKILRENEEGQLNFSRDTIHPLTKAPVTSWYRPGETWDSMFLSMSSPMEECRAECVGIYLCPDKEVLDLFGHHSDTDEIHDIAYTNWLIMVRAGLRALEFYTPETKRWRQAHMQARFAIFKVLREAGAGLLTLEQSDDDVVLHLDRSKILSVGVPAIGAFLEKLNVYKATADVNAGTTMFEGYTTVTSDYEQLREIVLKRKQPRQVFVQSRTCQQGSDGEVLLVNYDASPEGLVQSFVDRFAA